MTAPLTAIKKLRAPPGVHNWVKNIRPRTDDMAHSLYNFAVNGPRHSLKPVENVIRQVVVDGISDEDAFKCLDLITNERVRKYGRQILIALLPHIREKGWKGIQIFKNMCERYPVAANVSVPVRPTFVVRQNGKAVPYFVICWTEIGLKGYQKRILTTLIQEAILSQEDFEGSDAVIVCVPRHSFSKSERYVVEWKLSDHPALSADEKADLFRRYGQALQVAEKMILENLG
jgi:hypothetical protein